jgi:hypothetical protein
MVATIDFSAVVESLGIVTSTAIEERRCPDQYIGRLGDLASTTAITYRSGAESRLDGRGLLVVLESPHIAEFADEPGPARGTTGSNIAKYLCEIAPTGVSLDLPVLLINAVQFQCSLGYPTKRYRDSIFSAVWTQGGRADFVGRLRRVFRPQDLVLCCCTKGASRKPASQLRQLVYQAISEALPEVICLRRTHPAGWHNSHLRQYVWTIA